MKALRILCIVCAAALCFPAAFAQKPDKVDAEEQEFREALADAGTSTVDFIRVIEAHLAKYPNSTQRADMERALAKAAIETKDNARIIRYGERVLSRDPGDLLLLERVTRALLTKDDKASSERALQYAQQFEKGVRAADKDHVSGRGNEAEWREDVDRGLNRALLYQARATGNLGKLPEALALARQSYDLYPNAEAAREVARWLARSGREEEAIQHYADAFTIPDLRRTDAEMAADRARMGEIYRKLKGSETGLGDLILQAYDRTAALMAKRREAMRAADPNAGLKKPSEFVLSDLNGGKLAMSSLRGKLVVMDFWATWCGPCRVQQPLYQKVKERFRDRPEVVFLSINTDQERDGVRGFLEKNNWDKKVYFEDGLSVALNVSSIPTTILLGKDGEVVSRMNGFVPDRFVDMLSARIEQILNQRSSR